MKMTCLDSRLEAKGNCEKSITRTSKLVPPLNQQERWQLYLPSDLKKADPDFPPWAPHATECCSERMYLQQTSYIQSRVFVTMFLCF